MSTTNGERGVIPAAAIDPADVEARVIDLDGRPTISLRRRSDRTHLADFRSVRDLEAAGFDLAEIRVV